MDDDNKKIDIVDQIFLEDKETGSNETGSVVESPKSDTNKDRNPRFKKDFKGKRTFFKSDRDSYDDDLESNMISVRAVSKTRTGGRIRSFSVLVVVGNRKGLIGCGMGKSSDISEAIKKAERKAKLTLINIPMKGKTISYNVKESFCGVTIVLRQVPIGSGIMKAGGVARKVLDMAGISEISCKCIGNSMSAHNVVYGMMKCFKSLLPLHEIAGGLGKTIPELLARKYANSKMKNNNHILGMKKIHAINEPKTIDEQKVQNGGVNGV